MGTFRMSEDLKKEVNRPSTKQLLNNSLGRFFRKTETIFGASVENGL